MGIGIARLLLFPKLVLGSRVSGSQATTIRRRLAQWRAGGLGGLANGITQARRISKIRQGGQAAEGDDGPAEGRDGRSGRCLTRGIVTLYEGVKPKRYGHLAPPGARLVPLVVDMLGASGQRRPSGGGGFGTDAGKDSCPNCGLAEREEILLLGFDS